MVNDFQKGSLSTRLGIPMIYGIDAVHGHNNVYKATVFPHNVGLGATRQVDYMIRCKGKGNERFAFTQLPVYPFYHKIIGTKK